MVGTGCGGDAEISAKEGAAEFGDQLFHGIGGTAEAVREITVKAMLGAGPVTLMPISA